MKSLFKINEFLNQEFGFKIKKTKLKMYSEKEWKEFCSKNLFHVKSEGVFIPQSLTAYVKAESPYLVLNIYHEFFGHGLFCEHSLIGKKLRYLNNKDADSYLYNKINSKEQRLGICDYNIYNYEGFAMWLEGLLSEETNYSDLFEEKMSALPKTNKELLTYFKEAEQELTRFGFLAQMGFPKHYTPRTLDDFLKEKYEEYEKAELILLYGSKKPYSDIDLFIITRKETKNYFNGWLDIYQINKEDFLNLLRLLDISIIDPLFTGTIIKGEERLVEEYKRRIIEQEITEEAVNHNLLMSMNQLFFSKNKELSKRERNIASSYSLSYLYHAKNLKQGIKNFSRKELLKE